MPKTKMTLADFKNWKKEGKKFTFVTAYDYTTATIVDESDVDIILVGDSLGMIMLGYKGTEPVTMDDMVHHIRPVVKGAPNTWIIGDMPFGSYQVSNEQAVENAIRLVKETGCDCVKLEGGVEMIDRIRAIAHAGVNTMGHIGLTPQTASSLGGFRVQGGTPESAAKLIRDAQALEEAGCFSLVLECVPKGVGKAVSEAVSIPVLGIGAGPYVDCQVLVLQDMLDMTYKGNLGHKPKFVKEFAHIRKAMVDGLNQFVTETKDGTFPSEEYCFNKEVAIPSLYGGGAEKK